MTIDEYTRNLLRRVKAMESSEELQLQELQLALNQTAQHNHQLGIAAEKQRAYMDFYGNTY